MSSDILFSMALVVLARSTRDCLLFVVVLMSTPCGAVPSLTSISNLLS